MPKRNGLMLYWCSKVFRVKSILVYERMRKSYVYQSVYHRWILDKIITELLFFWIWGLTASICWRARAACCCSLSFASLSFCIVDNLLVTLSLWRLPSSCVLMLKGLLAIKILQKSHHLFPWLTQYWNRADKRLVIIPKANLHNWMFSVARV